MKKSLIVSIASLLAFMLSACKKSPQQTDAIENNTPAPKVDTKTNREKVDELVRVYCNAFQTQDWELLVSLFHPKSLAELRKKAFVFIPKTSDEIDPEKLHDIQQVLELLSVKTPEEAWALSPKEMYLRMLENSSKMPQMKALKEVFTNIETVKFEEISGVYYVETKISSMLNGKAYSGATYFVIEHFEGELRVVSMSKTLKPRKPIVTE